MTLFTGSAPEGFAERPAKRLRQPSVVEVITDKKALDTAVAEFFYAAGMPLLLPRMNHKFQCRTFGFEHSITVAHVMQVCLVREDLSGNQW